MLLHHDTHIFSDSFAIVRKLVKQRTAAAQLVCGTPLPLCTFHTIDDAQQCLRCSSGLGVKSNYICNTCTFDQAVHKRGTPACQMCCIRSPLEVQEQLALPFNMSVNISPSNYCSMIGKQVISQLLNSDRGPSKVFIHIDAGM